MIISAAAISSCFYVVMAAGGGTSDPVFVKFVHAAREYQAALTNVRGTANLEVRSEKLSDPKVVLSTLTFARDDRKTLVRQVRRMEKDPNLFLETVLASDSNYTFYIEKSDRLGKFSLTSFRSTPKLESANSDEFYSAINRFLMSPVLVSSLHAEDLEHNPYFRIDRIESRDRDEYRIHYSLDDPSLTRGSGWFDISASSHYLVARSSCRLGKSPSTSRAMTTLTFPSNFNGHSPAERVEIHHESPGRDQINESRFELSSCLFTRTNIAEFRPMYYGLPDLSRSATTRWGLTGRQIMLIASPLLLLAAILLKRTSNRLRN